MCSVWSFNVLVHVRVVLVARSIYCSVVGYDKTASVLVAVFMSTRMGIAVSPGTRKALDSPLLQAYVLL